MSFSSDTKDELSRIEPESVCCMLAELAAIVSVSGTIGLMSAGRMRLTVESENAATARRVYTLFKRLFDVQPELTTLRHTRLGGRNTYRLTLHDDEAAFALEGCGILRRSEQGHIGIRRTIPKDIVSRKCCRRAFVRGAFLAGGSIANPEREYHLEFVVSDENFAASLMKFIGKYDLNVKVVHRKGSYVIYLKEGEQIVTLLSLIGAHAALCELENIRIQKDIRNNVNRMVNCDSANLQKTLDASTRQVEAIEYIRDHYGLENLPPLLCEVAKLRLDYREVSLQELGEMLDPPVGKSGVNHRLRRLYDFAQELRQKSEGGTPT